MDHATTNGNTLVVTGVLDLRRTAEVREALYALLSTTTGDVNVDLGDVDSIDMTILKMFVVANRQAERHGRRVVLRRCSPAVRRLLHLSHLRWMIPVEPDEGAADA